MSGGAFDYKQYQIDDIANELERIIDRNNDAPLEDRYSDKVMRKLLKGYRILRKASIYAHRIDWLESGDDGETTFLSRLKEELNDLDTGS